MVLEKIYPITDYNDIEYDSIFIKSQIYIHTLFLHDMIDINRENIEKYLGEQVEIIKGSQRALGLGVIAYEHNTGKLSVYSPDGKNLKAFLKGNEVLRFIKTPNEEYRIPRGITKS